MYNDFDTFDIVIFDLLINVSRLSNIRIFYINIYYHPSEEARR